MSINSLRHLGVVLLAGATSLSAASTANYHVTARYAIGGSQKGYDYLRLDGVSRRLFVAHESRVEVLDADSGALLGAIEGTQGVHGIEVIPTLNRGFTSNGVDRSVTVFDYKTLQPYKAIKYTGVKPDAIQFDAYSGQLFVVNGGATGDVTVIDPASATITATVDLGGKKLEQIGFDGRGHAFVNDEDLSVAHVFDTKSHKVLEKWALAPCEGPTGMAVDIAHHRLFAACGNNVLAVIDSDSGKVVATPKIGADPDGAAFDPETQRVFVSNRDGTLTIVHEDSPDKYSVVQNVTTEYGARTIAYDPKTGRVFVPTAKFGPTPAATKEVPEPRPPMLANSFAILVVSH